MAIAPLKPHLCALESTLFISQNSQMFLQGTWCVHSLRAATANSSLLPTVCFCKVNLGFCCTLSSATKHRATSNLGVLQVRSHKCTGPGLCKQHGQWIQIGYSPPFSHSLLSTQPCGVGEGKNSVPKDLAVKFKTQTNKYTSLYGEGNYRGWGRQRNSGKGSNQLGLEGIREDYPEFNSEFGRLNRKLTGRGGACGILGMDPRTSSKFTPSHDVRVRAHMCQSTEVLCSEARRPLSVDSGAP